MTAVVHMDHDQPYPAEYLATILKEVKTIAMVGASPDPTKFSYGVLRVLHETGYDMIPVNPNESGGEIRGLRVYESLAAIDRPVDMVQVFRTSDALVGIAREAIDIGAKVLWAQLGVRDDEAARLAEAAGLKVFPSLAAIARPVDMVQVFRSSEALPEVAREAIGIGAKVLWAQLGVRDDEAARMAEAAGLKVVMNRCPKIELFRPFWKPRLNPEL